jgi:hypothetical protein
MSFDTESCGGAQASSPKPIENEEGLQALVGKTWIRGNLIVTNADFQSLAGLEQLVCVEGDLKLSGNAALVSADGLQGLRFVKGNLIVGENDSPNEKLVSLDGLSALTQVGKSFRITRNPALEDLDSVGKLESIGDQLQIYDNASLTSLSGLSGLNFVGDTLNVAKNAKLSNCEATKLRDQLTDNHCRLSCIRKNASDNCQDDDKDCWYPEESD